MHKENQEIINQLNECAAECNHCYSECLNEKEVTMMARCIELDRECSDICQLTASMLARGSEHSLQLLKVCADICNTCAEECEKHDNEHCKRCSEVCYRCAESCYKYEPVR